MAKIFGATVVLGALALFVSSVQAITITLAEVQNGVAVVQGNKAEKNVAITWETSNVGQTTKGGAFSFFGIVPADCVGTLSDSVSTIDVALSNCAPTPEAALLATGQTTCWNDLGNSVACTGTGQDGEVRKGVARSYTDNADGSITDNSTGLIWEKLTNDTSIHNVGNIYT